MARVPLIPLLNRNLPSVVSCNDTGLIAYGTRDSIYIIHLKDTVPVVLDPKVLRSAHRGKVLSVSFCKLNGYDLLASIGEEALLKIWDLETVDCITSKELKDFSDVVEWPCGSSDFVVYPDRNGTVSKWNFRTNSLTEMKTCSESRVCCFASNRKSLDLLAVGHNTGSISVLNLKNEVLLYKFKNHVMEITSLSWSPISPTMLLSASMDQTARLWNLEENKLVQTYKYPRSRFKNEDKKSLRVCAIFHPDDPNIIICSNVRGNVGSVVFKENEEPKFIQFDSSASFSGFKSITQIIPYLVNKKRLMLSIDHLKISLWDILEHKLVSIFNFCCASIYDLAVSTVDPSLLAVGSAEGFVKVWDVSKSTNLEISTIYVNAHIKIMVVAWHPVEESILAYGSDEGRVGIVDIHKKKHLYSYETHHSNTVYCLQWAPCKKIKDSATDYFLYSCGCGSILINELFKSKENARDFNDLITVPSDFEISKTYSELCWKSDYTCLAVGNYKGVVSLFDDKLNFVSQVFLEMKTIECLKWHPRYTSTSSESTYSSWFAAAGNDSKIFILDISDIKREPDQNLHKPVRTLTGHKKRVSMVCWCPHKDGLLASASRDGTVLIWDILKTTILANYPCHRDLVHAVQWSAYDPDIIFSGGMDCCLRVWKISEQTSSAAPERSEAIRRKKFIKIPKTKESPSSSISFSSEHLNDFKPVVNELQKNSVESPDKEEIVTSIKNGGWKAKRDFHVMKEQKKSLFYNYTPKSKEENLEKVLRLTDLLSDQYDSADSEDISLISNKVTAEESLYCGLFCDQLTAIKMFETKAKSECESETGSFEREVYLHLMANDVESLLKSAAERKRLTDFLMASAATVSRKFYNEMCEKYSAQLIEEKSYVKAGIYLLFCGQLNNAISLLVDKGKILEALGLAKAHLPENDPFLHGVLRKAASYFSMLNQLPNEAACYLALKEPLQAARILFRESNPKHVYASLYICSKFNLKEAAESYAYFCMEKCLAHHDWATFYKAADLVPSLKVYNLLIRVHELFFKHMTVLKKEDGLTANNIFGVTGSKPQIWEIRTIPEKEFSFMPLIYDVIKNENIIPDDRVSLIEIHEALKAIENKRKKYEMPDEVHITVALYISQVIVMSLLGDSELVAKYFVKIFAQTCNIVFMPRVTYWLLLPFNLYWNSNEDLLLCESGYTGSDLLPFTDFFQETYDLLSTKFASLKTSVIENFGISQDILLNLKDVVQQTSVILSEKTPQDSLLLYFAVCYLDELRKLAKKGWKFRCYAEFISDNKVEESSQEVLIESDGFNDSYAKKEIALTCDNSEETKECEVELQLNGSENKNHEDITNLDNISMNENVPIQRSTVLSEEDCELNKPSEPTEIIKSSSLENGTSTSVVSNGNSSVDEIEKKTAEFSACETSNGVSLGNGEGSRSTLEYMTSQNAFGDGPSSSENSNVESEEHSNLSSDNFHENIEENILLDTINGQNSSSDSDDHAQCWADVSLYFILVKSFISIICRDEYALLFFLKKMFKVDHSVVDQTKDQSLNTVMPINSDSVSDSTHISEPEAKSNMLNSIQNLNGESECVESDNIKNCVMESEVKDVQYANSAETEDKDGESQLLQDEIAVHSNIIKNGILNGYTEAVNDGVNNDPATDVIDINKKEDTSQEISEKFQIEDKQNLEQVKLLDSVEFFYPNPLDAVSALNGICCDMVNKNPCQFVKEKFHELTHQIGKWKVKFSSGDEAVNCNICQEKISD